MAYTRYSIYAVARKNCLDCTSDLSYRYITRSDAVI